MPRNVLIAGFIGILLLVVGGAVLLTSGGKSGEWSPDGKPVRRRTYSDSDIDDIKRLHHLEMKQKEKTKESNPNPEPRTP